MNRIVRRLLLTGFFTLFAVTVSPQQYDCNCSEPLIVDGNYTLNMLVFREYHNPINSYRGEQFLNEWAKGSINLVNGEKINNITLRYDMFSDELLYLREDDFVTGIVNKDVVNTFQISASQSELSFVKKLIKLPAMDARISYLKVLVDREADLLVFRSVVKAISESRTVDNTIYYIFTEGDDFSPVKLRRGSLLKCSGIDRERMKKVLKENKLSLKDELNFARAVYLYNQNGL